MQLCSKFKVQISTAIVNGTFTRPYTEYTYIYIIYIIYILWKYYSIYLCNWQNKKLKTKLNHVNADD